MIEGILPTFRRDLDRFKMLRETLRHHAGDMTRVVVVVPDADMDAFRHVIGADRYYDLRPESAVLGRRSPKYLMHWAKKRPCRAGWYIQQAIKLACVATSSAEFCMTLDADLIAVNDIDASFLIRDGRAVDQVTDCGDQHGAWYTGSARILGKGVKRSGIEHPVTPSLLSPEACRALIQHLVGRVRPVIDRDWIGMLFNRVPWSEYTLYFTFLEQAGLFDRYHVIVNEPIVYDPYASVWTDDQIVDWDPSKRHPQTAFLIVQSTSAVTADVVQKRVIDPLFQHRFA